MSKENINDEPEWSAENINKKQGDTTFDICGWCKYVGCGSCRYGCHLDGSCNLMPNDKDGCYGYETYYLKETKRYNDKHDLTKLGKHDIQYIIDGYEYDIKGYSGRIKNLKEEIEILKRDIKLHSFMKPNHTPTKIEKDLYWNTPCLFKDGYTEEFIDYLVSAKESEIVFFEKIMMCKAGERIKELEDHLKNALEIPPQPYFRGAEHFNVKNKVMVWNDKKGWKQGTVVYGYRHHDGCVSFVFDGEPEPEYKYLKNCFDKEKQLKDWKEHQKIIEEIGKLAEAPGCGFAVPTVILKSEYDYFAKNPTLWDDWIRIACEKDYNGKKINPKDFKQPGGKL